MKQSLLTLGFMLMLGSTALAQAFTENFDNIPALFTTGWNQQNLSTPIGSNPTWVQGDATVFPAYNGATNAYLATNYNNVAGAGTISNWLLTPQLTLNNGDVISFYTRGTGSIYPDNLQVRLSTNGASTNVGASNTSVGDFTTMMLEVNPSLTAAGYPSTWTQYTLTVSGLPATTSGRFAFRYYVPNGGPNGVNSDYIGIDNIVYTPAPTCNVTATTTSTNPLGGSASGTINLSVAGGTSPYSFMWSNGSVVQNLNNLLPGCYTVVVNDANGCQATATTCLVNTPGPVVYATSNVVNSYQVVNGGFAPQWVCQNDTLYTDGGIMNIYLEAGATMITGGGIDSVFAKSGSTIIMNGGIHTIFHEPGVNLIINGGIPYVYPCTSLTFNYSQAPVNGCVPAPVCNLSSSATTTNIDCNGQASGSATVNVAGGTAPLTYAWSNGATSQTLSNVLAGTYTVTVTDANGCTVTQSVTITQASALNPLISTTNNLCAGANNGSIDLTVVGGTTPYLYNWSNGSNTEDLSNLASGSYTVTVTDGLGCTASTSVNITQPPALSITTASTDEMMGQDGTATATVNGGTAPYVYDWTPGGMSSAAIIGLTAGTYTLVVMDANGCSDTAEVVVGSQVGLDEQGAWVVSVYPNPAQDVLNIVMENPTVDDLSLAIYAMDGKLVKTFSMQGSEAQTLSLEGWPSGMYRVHVQSETQGYHLSFVKQ